MLKLDIMFDWVNVSVSWIVAIDILIIYQETYTNTHKNY